MQWRNTENKSLTVEQTDDTERTLSSNPQNN